MTDYLIGALIGAVLGAALVAWLMRGRRAASDADAGARSAVVEPGDEALEIGTFTANAVEQQRPARRIELARHVVEQQHRRIA